VGLEAPGPAKDSVTYARPGGETENPLALRLAFGIGFSPRTRSPSRRHPPFTLCNRSCSNKHTLKSRTCGCQSGSVQDHWQPQCPGLPKHSSNPNARSLSHSPSAPLLLLSHNLPIPRSLVRDGQTSPHRPRLVVSRSTCPPLSSPPPRTAL